MSEKKELLTTNRKALTINLDGTRYGTIAEIGAGQEVARIFFQAGGASGSIAKTMSAYDMTFSDAIYGKAPRYVSRERLHTMLDHEFRLLRERLAEKRGDRTRFFVFADTVVAKSFKGPDDGHGWMGVRFQHEPLAEPSEIIIHVRMWDRENLLQQQALGIVGVNLIHGAFHYCADPLQLVTSLVDGVGTDRIEVDMLRVSGPAFGACDNRLLALRLVQHGLTNAVMFSPAGEVLQPAELLHRKAVLVERGSFRPVTNVNVDMLTCATAQFRAEPMLQDKELVILLEITMKNLLAGGDLDAADFLARVDMLGHIGCTTVISNYPEFFRLVSYFRRYTKEMIGVVMGIDTLLEVFNEKYYEKLEGGILESMGRMFKHAVKLYIYPMRPEIFDRHLAAGPAAGAPRQEQAVPPDALITARNLQVAPRLRHLYAHLLENQNIDCIVGANPDYLNTFSRDVLPRLKAGDPGWEQMVPAKVAELIKGRKLLGYGATTTAA
jgi:hypothetical protein